ncbi:hypothetical protein DFH08DRAFT_827114 [Mycena albidolilacea]|uniref:Uncharacterized protein n=1 Tax=Mycena albidolilacea TaxID=1033008 RepID=A0AAD6YYY8_9AGAR|nr:hypothetical protein DFH08DRAFT_827114 [Mycena albidolilacea]
MTRKDNTALHLTKTTIHAIVLAANLREFRQARQLAPLSETEMSPLRKEARQGLRPRPSLSLLALHSWKTAARDALTAAQLDMERNWKAQKPSKLAMAYNTEKFPILRQCEGQWGVDRIAKADPLQLQELSTLCPQYRNLPWPSSGSPSHRCPSCGVNPLNPFAHSSHHDLLHPRLVSSALSVCWTILAASSRPASTPPELPDSDENLMDLDNDVQDNGDEDDEPELSLARWAGSEA